MSVGIDADGQPIVTERGIVMRPLFLLIESGWLDEDVVLEAAAALQKVCHTLHGQTRHRKGSKYSQQAVIVDSCEAYANLEESARTTFIQRKEPS